MLRVALLALLCSLAVSAVGAVTLVRDHQPAAAIHVAATATLPERFAAGELQRYLRQASGAELPLRVGPPAADEPALVVGLVSHLGDLGVAARGREKALGVEGLVLRASGNHLVVAGGGPRGVVYAAYDLLERLGYRWYWPGELGEVTPELADIELVDLDRVFEPSFARRHAMGGPSDGWEDVQWGKDMVDWLVKNHQNFWLQTPPGQENSEFLVQRGGTYTKVGTGHNWQHIIPPGTYFAEHPEYFAEVGGKRIPHGQLCLSNPEVMGMLRDYALAGAAQMARNPDVMFVDLTQNDGDDWCQCAECRAIDDRDPSTHADIVFWALNPIAEAVAAQHPGALLHTYIYSGSANPPNWIKPAANIHCEQTNYCYNYGASFLNPNSGPGTRFRANVDAWTPMCQVRGIYEYFGFYNWLEALPVTYYRLSDEVKYYKDIGVHGFYSETEQRWSTNHLLYYSFSRVWWDHRTDIPALIDEYCRLMYGPAAEPMRRFTMALETAGGPDRYISGNEFDLPRLFTPAVRAECRTALDEAREAAEGNDLVTRRLDFVELGWRYTELHLAAMEANAAFRRAPGAETKAAAKSAWQDFVAYFDELQGTHAFDRNDLRHFRQRAETDLAAYTLDLGSLPPGEISYQDALNDGGSARLHGKVEGFYDGVWGLSLYARGSGSVIYELGAEEGHAWKEARVALEASWREGLTSAVEVSLDGETWEALAENRTVTFSEEFDVTALTAGQPRFLIRVRYASTLPDEVAALHAVRLRGRID